MLPVVRILLATAYGYGCRFAEARDELAAALALAGRRERLCGPSLLCRRGPRVLRRLLDRTATRRAAVPRGGDLRPGGDRPGGPSRVSGSSRGCSNAYLLLDLGRFEEALAFSEALREEFRRLGVERPGGARAQLDPLDGAAPGWAAGMSWARSSRLPAGRRAEATCYAYRYLVPGRAPRGGRRGDAAEVAARIETARREMRGFGATFDESMVPLRLRHGGPRGGPHRARPRAGRGRARAPSTALGSPGPRPRGARRGARPNGRRRRRRPAGARRWR